MNSRPSETYHCNSKGCSNGYGSAFDAAPASWFAERGMTPPKNCPDCRKWIKAQGDQAVRCASCNRTMRLSARFKISHHKRTGPWALPEECRQCERGERPPRSALGLPQREKTLQPKRQPERKKMPDFTDLPHGVSVKSRPIAYDTAAYQHTVWNRDTRTRETRLEHIEHHMPGSPHSQVGKVLQAGARPKSPTAFVGASVKDAQALLTAAGIALYSADPFTTREYQHGNRIIRLTLLGDGHIERTVLQQRDTGDYEIVTTYDTITVEQAIATYGSKLVDRRVQ